MSNASETAGLAALSICEALLLAMSESGLLSGQEIVGVLRDASATHENAFGDERELARHRAVAGLINAISIDGSLSRQR